MTIDEKVLVIVVFENDGSTEWAVLTPPETKWDCRAIKSKSTKKHNQYIVFFFSG